MDEQKLVVVTDSLQSTSFTFLAVTWRNIVWSFSVPMWWNKHFPGQSAPAFIASSFWDVCLYAYLVK